ncbi:hypothetical protein DE146DRAFT_792768 [Phaeosphaeria sp. MPI-PUGE-AT-0046c]|nr:hypothetical protein DE146DRAFT_792768 [Phaeosphaeria sp. MPI-PUGE-AT-0046c]
MDLRQRHVFELLRPMCGLIAASDIRSLAYNIDFFIKYNGGMFIENYQVTITSIGTGFNKGVPNANITFLIKHAEGPGANANQVSITRTVIHNAEDVVVGVRVTVSVHLDAEYMHVVVSKKVKRSSDFPWALEKKVDKIIEKVLARDGNDAFGDL